MPMRNTVRLFASFSNQALFGRFSHQPIRLLSAANGQARVTFDKSGGALLTVPTPKGEMCRMVVPNDPQMTLANLAENLKKEGVAKDAVVFQSAADGVQLAKQTSPAWQVLSAHDVQLLFDGKALDVKVEGKLPALSSPPSDYLELAAAEKDLVKKAEQLRLQLAPLDSKVADMMDASYRRTRVMAWAGLAFMAAQFGFLARMTWWEYSWDIVEPISYFVTYGTAMVFYAYYVVTRQEANFVEMFDRQQLITVHKRMTKNEFDLPKYNKLRKELHDIESQLVNLKQFNWLSPKRKATTAS